MKNHFARTGIAPTVADEDIGSALAQAGASGEAELVADVDAAREVLEVAVRRMHYRRTHLQYRALAGALDALDDPIALDSHRWRERLIEFEPESQPSS